MRLLLRLISLIVPRSARARWREEWLAELQHGGWRMLLGALPDAWTVRKVLPAKAGSDKGLHLWLPASAGRPSRPFHGLGQDVRYSLRTLARSPGFVAGVVLSLALGIGGNIVAFTFINAAVFRPFPGVRHQHELVRISIGARDDHGFPVLERGAANVERVRLETLRTDLTTISGLSAHAEREFVFSIDDEPYAGPGGLVSSNYFDVLGVRAEAGRFFSADDDKPGAVPVAVISHATWQRRFGGGAAAIGSTMTVNGVVVQIVGVAAKGFQGVRKMGDTPEAWIPFSLAPLTLRDREGRPAGVENARVYIDYVGRRQPGAGIEQVQAQATVIAARMAERSSSNLRFVGSATRVWLNDPAESAPAIAAFMIIPFLVLAVACVNAANLLLARASRQSRDWSVRVALGASRWRVIRQVLAEAIILSLSSAAAGLLLARWVTGFVDRQMPVPLPFDSRVAFFTLLIALIAAVAFSLGPALGVLARAARRSVTGSSFTTRRSRVRFILVALQAALSLGLLTTGAQFANTVFANNPNAAKIPDPEGLVLASFDLDPLRATAEQSEDFYRRMVARARQVPGVAAAGLSAHGLVTGFLGTTTSLRLWATDTPVDGSTNFLAMPTSAGTMKAIGVPLIAGRDFTERDEAAFRSVVVNEPFARTFMKGDALGRSVRVAVSTSPERTYDVSIVGIAGGIMKRADSEPPILYHPVTLGPLHARVLYLRLDDSGRFSPPAIQAAAREVDPRVPVVDTSTLNDLLASRHLERKLLARGAAALGVLALILAAGGLYGVVSYVVSLRWQEIGIRLALGAEPRALVVMITRQALMPALTGAAVGLFSAGVIAVVVRSRFHGASPIDPMAFGAAPVLLVLVLFAATILPARRAARVDPVDTLRTE